MEREIEVNRIWVTRRGESQMQSFLLSLFLVLEKEEAIYTLKHLLEEDEEKRKVSKILIK